MPEHEHSARTLFETALLRVDDYRCGGGCAGRSEEEAATAHEIVLIRRGAFLREDAGGAVVADGNQALFFHADQPYQISHPVRGGDACTVFSPAPTLLRDLLAAHDSAAQDRIDQPFAQTASVITSREQLAHYQIFWWLGCNGDSDPIAVEEAIITLLDSVVAGIPRRYAAARRSAAGLTNAVKRVIAADLGSGKRLQLADIAAAVHYSPFFLCREFKRDTGLSIHQYVQQARLQRALDYLMDDPKQDLAALALTLGFSSHSHFSATFTRAFGLSPSAFRRK